jgi:hypothetical protein
MSAADSAAGLRRFAGWMMDTSPERAGLLKAADELDELRMLVGHLIVAAGGTVLIERHQVLQCQYPEISRVDDPAGDILFSATIANKGGNTP